MAWRGDIVVEEGDEAQLKTYEFGPKQIIHKFCQNCSTNLFVDHIRQTDIPGMGDISGYVGVNVRDLIEAMLLADFCRFELSMELTSTS